MSEHTATAPAADSTDPLSDAVISPAASGFLRAILEKAIGNPKGLDRAHLANAQALLANLIMNDYFNHWNDPTPDQVGKAEDAALAALRLASKLPLAHHALGLIHRARGEHDAARKAFEQAVANDPGFARAHAQLGNQEMLCKNFKKAFDHVNHAIELNPHHPAIGYFYWAKGRIFLQQEDWPQAIHWLQRSVEALPNVWYNQAYLAYAQEQHKHSNAAETRRKLTGNALFHKKLADLGSSRKETADDPGAKMRNCLRDWLQNSQGRAAL